MKRSYLFWGVILILFGGIFFLNGKNLLPGNPFDYLWQIFLILLGTWIILNSLWKRKNDKAEYSSIALNSATRAKIRINHGAGRLNIKSGANQGKVITYSSMGSIQHDTRYEDDYLDIRLYPITDIIPLVGLGEGFNWDIQLNADIPTILILETGASQCLVDLSELNIPELKLSTGASTSTLILPSTIKRSSVSINAGVASLNIKIPEKVKARIRVKEGLSSMTIDKNRFKRVDANTYQSLEFSNSDYQTDIKIESGVGTISIQ